MTLVTPPLFTGIAFDSGGVASGPMSTSFLLSFALGVSGSADMGFGLVGLIAISPLIASQILICLGIGTSAPLIWSMMADVADWSAWKNGTSSTGLIFSSSSMAQKFGGALGGFLLLLGIIFRFKEKGGKKEVRDAGTAK